jgi:hypothetical protein
MISAIEVIHYDCEEGSCKTACKYIDDYLVGAWSSCQACKFHAGHYQNYNTVICRYIHCQIYETMNSEGKITEDQLKAIRLAIESMEIDLKELKELEGMRDE